MSLLAGFNQLSLIKPFPYATTFWPSSQDRKFLPDRLKRLSLFSLTQRHFQNP